MQMFVCSPVKTALQPQITVHFLANYAQWVAYYFTLNISLGYETLFIDSSGPQSLGAALEREKRHRGIEMVKERKSEKKERRFLRGEQNYSVKEKSDFTVLVDFISFIFKSKPHRETLCTFYNSFFFVISWTLRCFLCPMRKSTKKAQAWASRAD